MNFLSKTHRGEAFVGFIFFIFSVIIIVGLIVTLAWGWPKYRIYKQDLRGQAELREAEWTKKISIEEARAKMESAELLSQAEVARARGVAEANKIIGDSLRGNESYLRYLWIDKLSDNPNVIYVPTEAGLPLLEAGKRP